MNQMTSGGAERVVSILANGMVNKDQNVSLVITFESDIEYKINKDVNIIKLNIKKDIGQIKRNLIEIEKLVKIFKDNKPDIIISFIRNVNCIISAKIVGIPVIISERNNPLYDPPNKFWRVARKIVYPYADGIVFQSEGAKKYFSKRIQNKGYIIKNPLSNELPLKKNYNIKKEIITVGRLSEQKDQKTLINAFYILKKKYPEYKLTIYGEGKLRQELQNLINELNLEDSISMPGTIKNIYERIIQADMFVFTSIYEGYPNSLIEAMSTGLPVISTDCDYGPREIIENDKNGILVPIGNYIEIANKMEKIIENKEFAKKLGAEATKIRDELQCNKIIDEWFQYILNVIN